VTKIVNWTGLDPDLTQTFEICIQGPSYPVTPNCKTIDFDGGLLTWTNLLPGPYIITESALGEWWLVNISGSPATVPVGGVGHATVTNTRRIWAFTPGFWKNHTVDSASGHDAWQYTNYSPTDSLPFVLGSFAGLQIKGSTDTYGSLSMWEALSLKGGTNAKGALEILLRAGTAAVLNASFHEKMHGGVEGYYPFSTAELIPMINAAIASGQRDGMLSLAAELDGYNNGYHYIEWWWNPNLPLPQTP